VKNRQIFLTPIAACLTAAVGLFFGSAGRAGETAFQLPGRVIIVTAQVNGKGPYNLILDSGATHTVITPPTAEAIGLTAYPAGTGQKIAVDTSVSIAGETVRGLSVYIFDPLQAVPLRLNHGVNYHGIVGYDFLSQFIVTIDYKRGRLTLEPLPPLATGARPAAADTLPRDGVRVPFEIVGNMIQAKGFVNGRGPLTFLIDTGAAETVITPQTAKALDLKGTASTTQTGVWFTTLDEITAGKAVARDVPSVIHMPAQEKAGAVRYHGILGYSYLSRFRVTIDYRGKRLVFEPVDQTEQ
jgi:predicted aspartyl protease